jgi:hypothetical protein
MPVLDDWLDEAEMASEIGVSVRTLRQWRPTRILGAQ